MNRNEHYREAERLLHQALLGSETGGYHSERGARLIAQAQVHATLASVSELVCE